MKNSTSCRRARDFRQKFDAIRERFRDAPIHLRNVFVRIGEERWPII